MDSPGGMRSVSAMWRGIAIMLAVVPALFLTDEQGPHATVEEALALRVEGFFFAQQLQAARCDGLLREAGRPNTPSHGDIHLSILRRHSQPIGELILVATRYWRKMYGSRWGEYAARRTIELAESVQPLLATTPAPCLEHAEELMRRLEADWPALLRRIGWVPTAETYRLDNG